MTGMENTASDRFAVVQDVYQLKDWQAAAALLAEVLGLPAVTANQQVRRSRGFLATKLSASLAQRLQKACAAHGIAVQVVPQSEVFPVVKLPRVHRVCIADDGLWVQTPGHDANRPIAWDMLRLIAVTKTTKSESFQHWDIAAGEDEGRLKVTAYKDDSIDYLADVFAVQPDREVDGVRLFSRELNYSGVVDAITPDASADANVRVNGFRLLLSSIAAHATHAHVPPESQALLNQPVRKNAQVRPTSLADFEGHNRWLLQRLSLQGLPPDDVKLGLR